MAEFPVTKPEFIVPSCVNLSTYIQGMSDYEVRCYYSQLVQQWATEWAQMQTQWSSQQQAFESFKTYVNNKLQTFQDWFDNLDVQNEINNKIDDMIQDGTLSDIVSSALNGKYQPIVVNSTSDMADRSAIYILSTNGHVYQWNGNSFEDTSMVYNLPSKVYSFVGGLPQNTNLRNPEGVNVGCYSVNINNIEGVPEDFEGVYGVYYLLYYTSSTSHSALLLDLYGNMWLCQPSDNKKINYPDLSSYYKYRGSLTNNINIATDSSLQPGTYAFTAANISGLPSDFTAQYGYVINYFYNFETSMLRILYDTGANMWVCTGYGFNRVNPPFYAGTFPENDIFELLPSSYIGRLTTVGPTVQNLPPEYGPSSYGFLYNIYSAQSSRLQVLYPAFRSSKTWTITYNNSGWIQNGPSKQTFKEKICFIGDSITAKTFRANVGFVDLIQNWTNCNVQNLGVSGSGFNAGEAYINRIASIDSDVTLIAVSCSFNDLNTLPIGTAEDSSNSTLGGLMNQFFDSIQNSFPLVKIVGYTTNAWSGARPGNETAESYVNVFKEICESRCIPFEPVWKECNLRPWVSQQQTEFFTAPNGQTDQTHPNDSGHKLLAPIIYELIYKTLAINM